jgi:hypothetical protein
MILTWTGIQDFVLEFFWPGVTVKIAKILE